MRKIYNMYKLVKLVDELVEDHEQKSPTPLKNSGVDLWHPSTAYVKGELVLRNKNITHQQATSLVADCIKNKYLHGYTQTHNGTSVDALCIIEDGRDLLDTVPFLPFIKIGLYEALWEKHGGFISGVFIGILVPTFIATAKHLYQKFL